MYTIKVHSGFFGGIYTCKCFIKTPSRDKTCYKWLKTVINTDLLM